MGIKNLEEIYLFSMRIKEYQIVDHLLGEDTLKDEAMKVMPVQKQTSAGQRTRFKASLPLATVLVMLVSDGSAVRKLQAPSVVPSSLRKCPWFQFAEVIGVPSSVSHTLYHAS